MLICMKTSVFPLTLMLNLVVADNFVDKFYAILSLAGSEKYYLEMKRSETQQSSTHHLEEETPIKEKMAICELIVGSPLFQKIYLVKAVSPYEKAVHLNLKVSNGTDADERLYKWENSSNTLQFEDEYRLFNISVGRTVVQEYAFTCLARKKKFVGHPDPDKIVEYFVSPEYNLNVRVNNSARMGRFIFTHNKNGKRIVVVALAEEPGTNIEEYASEHLNTEFRDATRRGFESGANATICALNMLQKVRLCARILGAVGYRRKFDFTGDEDDVYPECSFREIHFMSPNFDSGHCHSCGRSEEQRRPVSNEKPVGEWMLGCQTEQNFVVYSGPYVHHLLIEDFNSVSFSNYKHQEFRKIIYQYTDEGTRILMN